MSASDFFDRWAKRKSDAQVERSAEPVQGDGVISQQSAEGARQPAEPAPPTMDDVQKLTPQSDYSVFVKRGVDEDVKRSALKKLFTDPHFNVMDGLDIYIDDYSKPDPIPAAMLASLNHAKDLLNPLAASQRRWMTMLDPEPEVVEQEKSEDKEKVLEDGASPKTQEASSEATAPVAEEPQQEHAAQAAQIPDTPGTPGTLGTKASPVTESEQQPDAISDSEAGNERETNQDPR